MRFYVCEWVPHWLDPIVGVQPRGTAGLAYGAVDFRPPGSTTGVALVGLPNNERIAGRDRIADLGDDPLSLPNATRNALQAILDGVSGGGTLATTSTLARAIWELLHDHGDDTNPGRWNRLRRTGGAWQVWMAGQLLYSTPATVSGGSGTDTFNRSNENLDASSEWTTGSFSNRWQVISNQAECSVANTSANTGGFHYVRADGTTLINATDDNGGVWRDATSWAVGGSNNGDMVAGPMARMNDTTSGYGAVVTHTDGSFVDWSIMVSQTGSRSYVGSHTSNAPTPPDKVECKANGSTIEVILNDSSILSQTNTTITAGKASGMVMWCRNDSANIVRVDEFDAVNYGVAQSTTQAGFRIRSDDTQGLNTDAGWAAAKNTNASLTPERRFRIRFELSAAGSVTDGYKLQYSRNSGAWTDVPNSTSHFASGAAMKTTNAVPSDQYADLAATTQVISAGSFIAGSGCETNTTASQSLTASDVTEHEFCVCLHKLTDALGENPDGTTFDFRLVYDDGTVLETYSQTPRVTVAALDGLIGGTVPEQPSNAGPWADANGVLYILVEHAETNPGIAMMKSADDGVTWDRVDHANRPTTTDWEGVSGKVDDDGHTIHIALRTSDTLYYHNFRMASHATNPDTWGVKDENLGATGAKTNSSDSVDLVYRGGTDPIVISYHGASAVHVRTGSTGAWNTAQNIDTSTGTYTGVRGTRLSDNTVMLIYKKADATAELRFKTLSTADVLSPAQASAGTQITTNIQALGNNTQTHDFTDGVVHDDGGVEVVTVGWMTTSPNNQIATVEIRDGTVQSELVASDAEARDSDSGGQAGGGGEIFDIAGDPTDKKVYAYWCDNTDTTLLLSATSTDGAAWTTPATFEDLDTDGADGTTAWTYIRARRVTHSTNEVVAVITGSAEGGTGRARYFETVIRAAGAPVAVDFTPMTVAASMPTVTVTPTTEVDITAMTSTATMPALDVVPTTEVDVTAMTVASTMPTVTVTATTEVDFTAMTSTATMPALDVVPTTEVDFTSMTVAATMPVVNTSTQDVDFTPMTVASTMPALDVTATAEVDFTSMTSSSTMPALDVVPTTEVDVTSMTVASTMPVVTVTAQADVDITAMTVAASMPVVAVTATAEVDFTPMTVAPTMPVVNTSTTIEVDFTSMTVAATMPALDVVATTEVDATPMTIASAMPVVSVTATTEVDFTSMTSTASMPVVNTDVGAVVDFTSMTSAASMPVVTVTAQADVDITPMTVALVMPVFNVTGVGSWGWKETTQPPVGTVGWQKTGV